MENTEQNSICSEVLAQFEALQQQRKPLDRQWELNLEFVNGNQYRRINGAGEICTGEKEFGWEQRRVFNHIAPIIDIRLSKLAGVRPALTVRAASGEEGDMQAAALASQILSSVQDGCDLDGVMAKATMWSEICGTAFYKVVWNSSGGKKVGQTEDGGIFEGEVGVAALSPFEIYPFSLYEESVEKQQGIIQAKAIPVTSVYDMYGVKLEGRPAGEFSTPPAAYKGEDGLSGANCELVIERYLRPDADCPEGRLTVVAGEVLLYDGPLPYINGPDGARGYPFIKQTSIPSAGNFFGTSVVTRLIPVQRAYNAVKNRKHEFLNRIAMGTVAVEDGSVDLEELAEDGLAPGKILVYRQGGTPPQMLSLGNVPEEFWKEEESLLSEFFRISGTSELSEKADGFSGVTSATGLQLIIEQDDARLNIAYQSLKQAVRAIGKHILRLYRQFAAEVRLLRYADGDGKTKKVKFFRGADISGEDVVLEADSDLNLTPAQRRTIIFELMDRGLFCGDDGKIPAYVKKKLLEIMGYASLADAAEGRNKEEI